jgi:adenosylcobinamide kinase/adenosylcobinamide-phosphate guanylyltransferase
VLHLDGKQERQATDPAVLSRWQDQAARALEIVAAWAGGPERLAVENLEGYPPGFNQPVLDRVAVSRCVDIGHLWLDGVPVLPYLEQALPRARVIHLHGIGQRDHASLSHVPPDELDRVLDFLNARYRGVLTVEVFSEADFLSSATALRSSLERLSAAAARPELTFILGGARSGKSDYAQELASRAGGSVLYVATATAGDDEMRARIAAHRAARPGGWRTLEAPLNTADAIDRALAEQPAGVVLLDCLTLLASNVILQLPEGTGEREASAALLAEVDALLACARRSDARWIIVSNEVGLGLVPPYPLGRVFRDALGRANQRLAAAADRAVWMAAGIPVPLPRRAEPD